MGKIAPGIYDVIFAQAALGTTIPVAYLRSLAMQESGLHPAAVGPGKERGLLQIHPVTLVAYNLANNMSVTADKSADPIVNATIAVWLLKRIIQSFTKNHPRALKEDWGSRRWVGLVTQAYNVGESEEAGVGKLVTMLELQGISPERITPQTVAQANTVSKINKWASDAKRLAYIQRVVDGYFGTAELPLPEIVEASPKTSGHGSSGSESWPFSSEPANRKG